MLLVNTTPLKYNLDVAIDDRDYKHFRFYECLPGNQDPLEEFRWANSSKYLLEVKWAYSVLKIN